LPPAPRFPQLDRPPPTYPRRRLPDFDFEAHDSFLVRMLRRFEDLQRGSPYAPQRMRDASHLTFRTAASAGADDAEDEALALLSVQPRLRATPIVPREVVRLTKRRRARATGVVPGHSSAGGRAGSGRKGESAAMASRGRSGSFASSVGGDSVDGEPSKRARGGSVGSDGDAGSAEGSHGGSVLSEDSSGDEEDYNDYAEGADVDDDDDGGGDGGDDGGGEDAM